MYVDLSGVGALGGANIFSMCPLEKKTIEVTWLGSEIQYLKLSEVKV